MTAIIDFAPSNQSPFQFQPTLDGTNYTAIITWNTFDQRWYLNLYTLAGVLVICTALVGSPAGQILQTLSWASGAVTATTSVPHGYAIGQTVNLTISGVSPAGYNGTFDVLVTGPNTFTYSVTNDPGGSASSPGSAFYNISLVAPLFTSTLVYRAANNQFEVDP